MGELAVPFKFPRAVVDRPVFRYISIPLVDQLPDHLDHAVDLFRRLGVRRGRLDVEAGHVLLALVDVSLGDHAGINALFHCLFDDLVVHIREVGHIVHLVSLVFKIAPYRVKNDHGPSVPDVDQVVDGGTAYIHADLPGLYRDELFFASGHRVENLHR